MINGEFGSKKGVFAECGYLVPAVVHGRCGWWPLDLQLWNTCFWYGEGLWCGEPLHKNGWVVDSISFVDDHSDDSFFVKQFRACLKWPFDCDAWPGTKVPAKDHWRACLNQAHLRWKVRVCFCIFHWGMCGIVWAKTKTNAKLSTPTWKGSYTKMINLMGPLVPQNCPIPIETSNRFRVTGRRWHGRAAVPGKLWWSETSHVFRKCIAVRKWSRSSSELAPQVPWWA